MTKVFIIGLPTPFELTGDPKWHEGGDLLEKYDLELDFRAGIKGYQGVKTVSSCGLDTSGNSEPVENVNNIDDDENAIKVSRPDLDMEDDFIEEDERDLVEGVLSFSDMFGMKGSLL